MFSSKSFIESGLIIRSLIHFEFIFVYGVRKYSTFILFHVAVQFSQHCLLKGLSFLHSCLLCHRLVDCRCTGLILGFLSCSTDLYFCFCARILCYCFFVVVVLFLIYFLLLFPPTHFFFPTVEHGDQITHTCVHSFFSHCHAAL